MKKIIFGSANHWNSPYQVGSHAWARLFARNDYQVAYISDPVTPFHWLARDSKERNRERFALWKSNGITAENGKLRAWTPCSLVSPRNSAGFRSDWVLNHWENLTCPSLEGKLRNWGFDSPDFLWLDSVRHFIWGRELGPLKTVLRVADWNAGLDAVPPSLLSLENRLLGGADLVITAAQSLEKRLSPLRKGHPMRTIRNGVDTAFWMKSCEMPPEYPSIPEPRVIYVGALDRWFDLSLLLEVARALPKVSFVMIGQRRFSLADDQSSNIHWLGARTPEQARGYVQFAQVGMIPFKRNDLVDCVCPLKLYEYMACGLPVVATRWEELELMDSPAQLATGAEEWIAHLKALLSSDLSEKEKWTTYAQSNDWQQRWPQWKEFYQVSC